MDPTSTDTQIAAAADADAQAKHALIRRLTMNTLVQVSGNFGASVIGFFTFVVVTRGLGAADFGDLTTALAYLLIPVLLADTGLSTVVLREISARPERTEAVMRAAVPLRILVSVFMVGTAAALAFVLPFNGDVRAAIAIGSVGSFLTLIGQGLLPVLQARLKMHLAVLAIVAGRLGTLGLTLAALATEKGIEGVIAATVVGAAITLLLQLVAVARMISLVPVVDLAYWRVLLRGSVTIGLALALAQIYFRIDTLLIAALRDPVEVGLYGAAFKLVELSDLVGAAVGISVFPLLARFVETDVRRASNLFQRAFDLLIAAAVPLVLVMSFAATPVVVLISGEEFREAGDALRLLAPKVLLAFVSGLCWRMMIAFGEDRPLLALAGGLLTLNVMANLVAISYFGFRGAAAVSVLTELVAVSASVALLQRRHAFLPNLRYGAAVVPAAALMTLLLVALDWPILLRTALAGAAYVGVLLALPGTVRDTAGSSVPPVLRRIRRP